MTVGLLNSRAGYPGTGWYPIKIGAGGYIVDIKQSADGSILLANTDSNNAWLSKNGGKFNALVTTASMPSTVVDPSAEQFIGGCYAINFAPSNLNRMYMVYGSDAGNGLPTGGIFISNDQGTTWTLCAGQPQTNVCNSNNSFYKFLNNKLVVDPANQDVVYAALAPRTDDITVSVVNGSPGVFHSTAINNNFVANDKVIFTAGNTLNGAPGSALPTGISPGVEYFVMSTGLTTSTFSVSTSSGNVGPVTISGTLSGTVIAGKSSPAAYVSTNAGTSWTAVPNIPNTGTIPAGGMFFDPSSSVVGGKTQGIYIFSRDNGLYHSTNGGTSFSLVASSPTQQLHSAIALDGTYYMTNPDYTALMKLSAGTWTNITPPAGQPDAVAVSPFDVNTVINVQNGGFIIYSRSKGSTGTWVSGPTVTQTATDIPWLANAHDTFMAVGNVIMDNQVADKLWFAEGIGVWFSNPVSSNPAQNWNSFSANIEELIGNQIRAAPNGKVYAAYWDRSLFVISNPDIYQSDYGTDPTHAVAINPGASVDWSSSDTNHIYLLADRNSEQSAHSSDGGVNWTVMGNIGALNNFPDGCIASASPTSVIWCPANNENPWRSSNSGVSWTRMVAADFGATGLQNQTQPNTNVFTGWNRAFFLKNVNCVADRDFVNAPNTYYIWNFQTTALGGGFYKTTNGGVSWTRVNTALNNGGAFGNNVKLCAADGKAGHLFFTAGLNDSSSLQYSRNGASSWIAVGSGATLVGSTYCVGTGAIKPGNDYPSVYFVGYYGGVYGVWRSDSSDTAWSTNAQTFTQVGPTPNPLNSGAQIVSIDGDKNVWGRVYVLTSNAAGFYYRP